MAHRQLKASFLALSTVVTANLKRESHIEMIFHELEVPHEYMYLQTRWAHNKFQLLTSQDKEDEDQSVYNCVQKPHIHISCTNVLNKKPLRSETYNLVIWESSRFGPSRE